MDTLVLLGSFALLCALGVIVQTHVTVYSAS